MVIQCCKVGFHKFEGTVANLHWETRLTSLLVTGINVVSKVLFWNEPETINYRKLLGVRAGK